MLVVVVLSFVISSSCARDCVFMTRDMLRIMAQENLMCSSRPTLFSVFSIFQFIIFFVFFLFSFLTSPYPLPKTSLLPSKISISRHDSGREKKKKGRRNKKVERRTRRQKEVPFHNRTHRTFLLFACVETPHSDQFGNRTLSGFFS